MIVLLAAAIVSCQKDPSTSDLHKDYLVYTDYDGGTNFSSFGTYYIPDSILLIGGADKTEYWKNTQALEIVGKAAASLDALTQVPRSAARSPPTSTDADSSAPTTRRRPTWACRSATSAA